MSRFPTSMSLYVQQYAGHLSQSYFTRTGMGNGLLFFIGAGEMNAILDDQSAAAFTCAPPTARSSSPRKAATAFIPWIPALSSAAPL